MTIEISTECGHSFAISEEATPSWESALSNLETCKVGTTGPTFDCKICNELCILVVTPDGVTGKLFHRYLHSIDSRWPEDGSNVYSASF